MDQHKFKFASMMLAYAAQRGIDPGKLCSGTDVDFKSIRHGQRVDVSKAALNQLWTNAVRLTGDQHFGMHFAETLQLAALGIVGNLVQTSRTVGEALTTGVSHASLVYEEFRMTVIKSRKTFGVKITGPLDLLAREALPYVQMRDFLMVFVVQELDGLLFTRVRPESVLLPKSSVNPKTDRRRLEEYERALRCRPTLSGSQFLIEFPGEYWNEPLLTANYELQQMLLKKVSSLPVRRADSLRSKVLAHLNSNSYLGVQSLEDVAANFQLSPRSLQRKLRLEGCSFQQLADEVKRDLALYYVRLGNYPMKEISIMLGYNESSAFSRAFKRWTGKYPVQFEA